MLRDAFDARPLFSRNSTARLGNEMSAEERADAEARIARRGETLVVQDIAPLGVAPVYDGGIFGTRPVSLRVFATWTPQGYMVMPGGLTRVAADETVGALSMQSGASSKDAWVLSEAPVDKFSLLNNQGRTVEIKRHGESAPSRAMDNLFWLGRYAERTESLVRILRAVASRLGDAPDAALELNRKLLVPFAESAETPATVEKTDRRNGAGRRIADPDLWPPPEPRPATAVVAGGIHRLVGARPAVGRYLAHHPCPDRKNERTVCRTKARASMHRMRAFTWTRWCGAPRRLSGLSAENMTRGPNWLFMDLGRRIERASHLAWLVRQTVYAADMHENDHIRTVLEIADSAMTYRSRYLGVFQIVPFVDLLLLDDANPRSVAFQLAAIENHLRELPRITLAQRSDLPGGIASEIRRTVANAHPARLSVCEHGVRASLGELTDTHPRRYGHAVGCAGRCLFPACQPPPHRRRPPWGRVMEYLA